MLPSGKKEGTNMSKKIPTINLNMIVDISDLIPYKQKLSAIKINKVLTLYDMLIGNRIEHIVFNQEERQDLIKLEQDIEVNVKVNMQIVSKNEQPIIFIREYSDVVAHFYSGSTKELHLSAYFYPMFYYDSKLRPNIFMEEKVGGKYLMNKKKSISKSMKKFSTDSVENGTYFSLKDNFEIEDVWFDKDMQYIKHIKETDKYFEIDNDKTEYKFKVVLDNDNKFIVPIYEVTLKNNQTKLAIPIVSCLKLISYYNLH